MTAEDAQKLAARLRDPECYTDACDEAADALVKMAQWIEDLEAAGKDYRAILRDNGIL